MANLTDDETSTVEAIVDSQIDLLYSAVAEQFDLETGDVGPAHVFEMDELKEKIANLMTNYVLVNK